MICIKCVNIKYINRALYRTHKRTASINTDDHIVYNMFHNKFESDVSGDCEKWLKHRKKNRENNFSFCVSVCFVRVCESILKVT